MCLYETRKLNVWHAAPQSGTVLAMLVVRYTCELNTCVPSFSSCPYPQSSGHSPSHVFYRNGGHEDVTTQLSEMRYCLECWCVLHFRTLRARDATRFVVTPGVSIGTCFSWFKDFICDLYGYEESEVQVINNAC